MNDIFICYSRNDIAIATRLIQHFQEEKWSVFIDKQTLVGRRWHKEIEKELHAAKAVVVLWSATSRESDYVLEEAEYGKRKEILFPAFIETVEYPYGFGRIQTADLIGWNGDTNHPGLQKLLSSLKSHLSYLPRLHAKEIFDVFLCHNNEDKSEIHRIADDLRKQGIKPWLDEWEIQPGTVWQKALEEQITSIKSCAIFVGKSGIGAWQNEEIRAFLNEFAAREGVPNFV